MRKVYLLVIVGALWTSARAQPVVQSDEWRNPINTILAVAHGTRPAIREFLAHKGAWIPKDAPQVPDVAPEAAVAFFQSESKKAPAREGDWLYEKFNWRLHFQAFQLADQLTQSPIADERRAGLRVVLWLLRSPYFLRYAPKLPSQIADTLLLPNIGAGLDDPTLPLSRVALLRVAADIYDDANRNFDAENALRAILAAASDPRYLNRADGARYQLAFRLKNDGRTTEALALLDSITHDSLGIGAREIAAKWRRELD